jgi:hypothetical protein
VSLLFKKKKKEKRRKDSKVVFRGLFDLQLILCGIKMNLEVPMVCQKYKSFIQVKFR